MRGDKTDKLPRREMILKLGEDRNIEENSRGVVFLGGGEEGEP